MSLQDSDAVRLRRSRLRTLASGVFVGAALAAMSFALREAGHRTAQQPVAAIPQEVSTQIAEATAQSAPKGPTLPLLVEKAPPASLRADISIQRATGKSGVISRVQQSEKADIKGSLARLRGESRSLAGIPDTDLSALKLGDRGLSPRKDLVAIDAARLPPGVPVIAKLGSRVVVPLDKVPEGLESAGGTLVQESESHRLGILTGVIVVQLKDWESRAEVAAAHGLEIQSEKPRIRYLFASVRSQSGELESAVAQVLAGLQHDPKVERAEPEVLFRPAEAK